MNSKLISFLLFVVLASSCAEKQKYPDAPEITYVGFEKLATTSGVDQEGVLIFNFTDGDGDFGLSAQDSLNPFGLNEDHYYNCYLKYYEKQNGVFVEIPLPATNDMRIPRATSNNTHTNLAGQVRLKLFINNPFSPYDTIQYRWYIEDRTLNKSNTLVSPEIKINK